MLEFDHLDETDAAPPTSTDLGPACGHLPDRSLAVGSPRADRGLGRGEDSAPSVQALARRSRRHVVARDDLDRFYRSRAPAVSPEVDRPVAARPRILA